MGKRKHKDKDDDLRRRIKRLEKRLRKNHEDANEQNQDPTREPSPPEDEDICIVDSLPESPPFLQPIDTPPIEAVITTQTDTTSETALDLPVEILNVLGQAKKVNSTLGEKILSQISERWGKILTDGLDKDQKEGLLKEILTPENFQLSVAPKLNPEVTSVLPDQIKNRDKRLEKAQNQLGSGIAGLAYLLNDLVTKEEVPKMTVIQKICEISQILLDLHYEESINRRKLILPLLDKSFWNVIQGVKRDEFLFGINLGENVKNTKTIEKTSLQIKKSTPQPPKQQGNLRAPPRQAVRPTAPVSAWSSATTKPREPYQQHYNSARRGPNPAAAGRSRAAAPAAPARTYNNNKRR